MKCNICGEEFSPKVYELHKKRCKKKEEKVIEDKECVETDNFEGGKAKTTEDRSLEEMTVPELKDLARENGIEGYSSKNKSDLIELLKGDE